MRRLLVVAIPVALICAALPAEAAPVRAFPEAEGFGAQVTGGRGGSVVHVTTLDDAGSGSLRDAVSAANRIVVFDVGGLIKIASPLVMSNNLTVAGQTAPGEGITVYGDGTSVSGRSNVILRYLRFRQGIDSGDGTKALNVTDGSKMIFDHLSVQWGRWDTIGLTGSTSAVTIQYSLLGESINPQRFGGLVDSATDITLSHNLWIDSQSRSPKFKANGQYINNVVYNWGANGLGGGHSAADWFEDIINNFFIKGPSSTGGFATGYATTDRVFNSGNLADLDLDGKLLGRPVVNADFQGDTPPTFETAAHNVPAVPVTVETAVAAYARVIAGAGASLCRDPVDLRLIGHVTSLGTKGAIVIDETVVGGQPDRPVVRRPAGFDTDRDGMPDAWETAHGLNPNSASDGNTDLDADGYSNLEGYLNALASAPPNSCGTTGPVDGGAGGTGAGGAAAGGASSGGGSLGRAGGGTAGSSTGPSQPSEAGAAGAAGATPSAAGGAGPAGGSPTGAPAGGSPASAGAGAAQSSSAGTSGAAEAASGCGCQLGMRSKLFHEYMLVALIGLTLGRRKRRSGLENH